MKIKNMKLMLLGLFGMMSVNAMAAAEAIGPEVGKTISRANLVFQVTKQALNDGTAGEATFLGMVASPDAKDADGAIANQPDGTITIPATVWTIYDPKGNKANYNVKKIDAGWATYGADVTATLTKLVSEVVEATSNLKATGFAKLAEVVLPAGQKDIAADAFSGCTKLAKINIENIEKFGDNALKETIITSIDLSKAKEIGACAFQGIKTVSTVTIPATVTKILDDAFADMYQPATKKAGVDADGDPITIDVPATGLTELTLNANDAITIIPDAFGGDALLAKVTITSAKATGFAAGAFADAKALQELDLSGCAALATINAGDFAAAPFTSVKLAGTKLRNIANLDLSGAKATLATITLPKVFGKDGDAVAAFGSADKFKNFVALTELDLSNTYITVIPDELCAYDKATAPKNAAGKPIPPVLATVKLNPTTKSIGSYAFANQKNLATVEGLNQGKLESIGMYAFNGTALTALDLSAATNAAFTAIPTFAFANAPLTTITLPAQIEEIYPAAFANDDKVTSINLQDLEGLTVLNPIFHEGVVDPYWYAASYWGYDIASTDNEVSIPLATVTLPENLEVINPGALQLLDIEEIVIPATVEYIYAYALQGCIKLKKFEWSDAQSRRIYNSAFRGDDHLEQVTMVTTTYTYGMPAIHVLTSDGDEDSTDPIDLIFKGNDKNVLTFTVNDEDYKSFIAKGWTVQNLKFCTLTTEGANVYEFKPASKTGEYYYSNYYNPGQASWFPEENFEVFAAVVEGSDVVLKAAATEGGFYKVKKGEACILRSKVQEAEYQLKNASFNDISTMPAVNHLIYGEDVTPSRLSYQYKLGVKGGVVAFYRIVTGKINGVYIQAKTAWDRLNIVFEDDATAIKGINKDGENNGAIYNLQGVRVNKAQKGLYIQNGKKYIMK